MLTRETALTNNPVLLETRFYEGTTLSDVYSVESVEIYLGDPRLPGFVHIQTITETEILVHYPTEQTIATSTGIVRTGVGIYEYEINPLTQPGLYFDKVYFIPLEDAAPDEVIGSFQVNQVSGAGAIPDSSIGFPRAELYGSILDGAGEPIVSAEVIVNKANVTGLLNGALIAFKSRRTKTNNIGQFSIEVLTGVELSVSIPSIGYRRIFVLNKDVSRQDIAKLDSFLYQPVDNPGETNNFLGTSTGEIVRPSSTGRVEPQFFQNEVNIPVFSWGPSRSSTT